jgi:hypothetical protein
MTYPIANVIYGCPFPNSMHTVPGEEPVEKSKRFMEAIERRLGHDDLLVLEEDGGSMWVSLYSASPDNDPAGYFGIALDVADGYWELRPEMFQREIPAGDKARVDAAWAELPEDLRECLGEPRLALAWGDS